MTKVPGAEGDPLKGIIQEHTQLITQFRIPSLDSLKSHFDVFTAEYFKMALMAYIGGEIIGSFNSRYGKALKKAAEGIATGAAGATFVMAAGGGGGLGHGSSNTTSPRQANYGY